jgi:hypothetical protein
MYCGRGHKLGLDEHGRYLARTRHVIDRLRHELHYSRVTIQRAGPSDTTTQRADLEARKRKLGIALADDAIAEDDYRRRMDAVKRDIAALDAIDASEWVGVGPRTPLVDWAAPDAELGEALRRVVRVVRLGSDMLPTNVELRVLVRRR